MRTSISFGLMAFMVIFASAWKASERRTVRAQMGVRTKAFRSGSMTGPPAERLYPVAPVWVAMIRPSDWHLRMGLLFL